MREFDFSKVKVLNTGTLQNIELFYGHFHEISKQV